MAPTASFVALEDAGEPVRDPELSRAWKANDMKATLFALSQFLHRDQMDRGRTACTARGNLDDLQRDSLSCPIRLSALLRFSMRSCRNGAPALAGHHGRAPPKENSPRWGSTTSAPPALRPQRCIFKQCSR